LHPQLKVYVSVHAYKQLWMYPWGHTKAPLSSPANARVAKVATDAINTFAHTKQWVSNLDKTSFRSKEK
jgi:hypothetical protein